MLDKLPELDDSTLSRVIPPEIKADAFHEIIRHLSATESLESVLEIGSSSGDGSTEAFVTGLSQNPGAPKLFCIEISRPRFEKLRETYKAYPFVHCYNRSTVRPDQFPTAESITAFYQSVPSGLQKFPLPLVLNWLDQDIRYVRKSGVPAGAIETIKSDHGIETFDMVLIDGSEFTGQVEYGLVKGARLILLDDTNTFKCYHVRQALLTDPMYDMIADDQTLRNGYSVFRRRATARQVGDTLPIHFFTIVLNGEPFIRYHDDVFRRLNVPWHWHVVEGVASLKHDTAWSVAAGGRVASTMHDRGRSNDGTTSYLDELASRFPENVTLYRKPLDEFWDGKREMVNAPLPNIPVESLLWQVDSDELWSVQQIETVHRLFTEQPDRTAAYYWCWYYVGPGKIISTRYNYAQNPQQEWLRTWRYTPGDEWATHEPPALVAASARGTIEKGTDIASIRPFMHDEMEKAGAVFHHFAYASERQVAFKELYYGYKDACSQWRALQAHKGSGMLKDFLAWVPDDTMFDDIIHYPSDPVATWEAASGQWIFHDPTQLSDIAQDGAVARPRIVVDGIFWQHLKSGIGRVWANLLREWVATGFTDNVIVLDRAGTAPRIPGVHYRTIARHDYSQTGRDSLYLEAVCRQLGADLFVSTYYSTPTTTPSFFSGYDMIPEVLGLNLDEEAWREKHRAIMHATAHGMISHSSARDLEKVFPSVAAGSTYVMHCGVDPHFVRPSAEDIEAFRERSGIGDSTYVLMVGERTGFSGYKNGSLVFRALGQLSDSHDLLLICVGGPPDIEPQLREMAPDLDVRHMSLSDEDLRAAYGGAHALLYPSRYEGFGMPPVECMACGTPAIVSRNSSLPEVVGDAALYVDESDSSELADAIVRLHDPVLRADMIERGYRQAAKFTFANMAEGMTRALLETYQRLRSETATAPGTAWVELRGFQQNCQEAADKARAVKEAKHIEPEQPPAPPPAEQPAVPSAADDVLDKALMTIASMQNSPFWKARDLAVRTLRRSGLRSRG